MSITKAVRVLALALVAAFVPASALAGTTYTAAPVAEVGRQQAGHQTVKGKDIKLKPFKGARLGAKATKGGTKVAQMKVTRKKVLPRGR